MTGDSILVAIGAVFGSALRFRLINHFKPLLAKTATATLLVNVMASFLLGLISTLLYSGYQSSRPLLLLLCTGFLGSLSTFSTFMVDGLLAWHDHQFRDCLGYLLLSLLLGVSALLLGQWVADFSI